MVKDPFKTLIDCHEHILDELCSFEEALLEVEKGGIQAFTRGQQRFRKMFEFVNTSVVMHTRDEEEGLFPVLDPKLKPRIRRTHFDRTPIRAIEEQHRKAEEAVRRLKFIFSKLEKPESQPRGKKLLAEFVGEGRALIDFYREHIRGENEVVFPLAKRILSDDEKQKVADVMNAIRRPNAERSAGTVS